MFKVKKAGVYINQDGGRQTKQAPESEKVYKIKNIKKPIGGKEL